MYTMVLMMAATTGGDTASFGLLRGSCHGSCHGASVVVTAPASCMGSTVVSSSCTGTPVSSCTGTPASSCHGSSCHGPSILDRLKAKFQRSSCHGSTSCTGAVVAPACCGGCGVAATSMMTSDCPPASAVVGTAAPVASPAVMPKAEPKKEEPKKKMD